MARTLRERGVTTVFALPGGHILPFLDASLDEDVRIIDTRHEGAAVLAAEGWALATGGTGVAAVTAGPGFANGLIGLARCRCLERPPGDGRRAAPAAIGRGAGPSATSTSEPSQRRSRSGRRRAPRPGRSLDTSRRRLHRARSGCPGAVYLEINSHAMYGKAAPLDVAAPGFPLSSHRIGLARRHRCGGRGAGRRRAPAHRRGQRLRSGRTPAMRSRRFAEAAHIPVITASAARGVVARFASVEPGIARPRRARDSERGLRPRPRIGVQRQRDVRRASPLRHRSDGHPGRHRRGASRRQPRPGPDGDRRLRLGGA